MLSGTEERLYFRLGTPFFPLLECKFSQKLLIKPLILGKARAWVPYRFRRPCSKARSLFRWAASNMPFFTISFPRERAKFNVVVCVVCFNDAVWI